MCDEEKVVIEAAYSLGLAYLCGDEVTQNEDLAIRWLKKAALKGHSDAEKILATIEQPEKENAFQENLIHKTARGEMVRSKSELIIADALFHLNIDYIYEKPLTFQYQKSIYPDFTIFCFSGGIILWEHLGMLDNLDYRMKWMRKKQLYIDNDFQIGKNLFLTWDLDGGRIDSQKIHQTANEINWLAHQGGL